MSLRAFRSIPFIWPSICSAVFDFEVDSIDSPRLTTGSFTVTPPTRGAGAGGGGGIEREIGS